MKSCPSRFALLVLAASLAWTGSTHAQRSATTARQAVDLVSSRFGPRAVQWLAEIRAQGGTPQPSDWEILAFDDRAPRLLYRFWAGGGRASDGGVDEQRYPLDIPMGYFSPNQIGVDSVAAFTIAEGEARKAKMAFDSCDYLLRVREFSTEPIWRLELLDASRRLVGKIYLSANSGEVLRTMWVYRGERSHPDGRPRIIDSFAPTQHSMTSGITRNDQPSLDSPLDPGGVARMPRDPDSLSDDGGLAGQSRPPAPQPPRMAPSDSGSGSAPQPYRPVAPDGSVADGSVTDDGIPDPPALEDDASGSSEGESAGSSGSSGSGQGREMRDLREGPAPPIEVPDDGSGGSSGRIPPPPVPQ